MYNQRFKINDDTINAKLDYWNKIKRGYEKSKEILENDDSITEIFKLYIQLQNVENVLKFLKNQGNTEFANSKEISQIIRTQSANDEDVTQLAKTIISINTSQAAKLW